MGSPLRCSKRRERCSQRCSCPASQSPRRRSRLSRCSTILAFWLWVTTGTGVEIADLARLDMPNCSVAANSISRSAIDLHGSTSSITAATLVTSGEVSFQGNPIDPAAPPPEFALASPARIGAPNIADPYAGALTHGFLIAGMPTAASCKSTNSGGVRIYDGNCVVAGTSLTRRRIRLSADTQISGSGISLTGQTVDLSPGTYWITGRFDRRAGRSAQVLGLRQRQRRGCHDHSDDAEQQDRHGVDGPQRNASISMRRVRGGSRVW